MTSGVRSEMLGRRYRAIREVTMRLCQTLTAEDCAAQSMTDASPTKWHLAHTTWFFERFLLSHQDSGYAVFHPRFEQLFDPCYDSVGVQFSRPDRGLLTRPCLDEVGQYRVHVDRAVTALLDDPGRLADELLDIVLLGLHHEQQHQELLLTDIKHLFAQSPLRPVYRATKQSGRAPIRSLQWHAFDSGLVEIGHPSAGFAFDHELPRHRVFLEDYALASRAIRNGEFAAFIEDGGYVRPELWLEEGFAKLQKRAWRAPLYWERHDEKWWAFTLGGLRPLRMEEPVCHVGFYEADAFARWAGCRLPSEAEWENAAVGTSVEGNFLEAGTFHPEAVRGAANRDGPLQLFGDVWEWTSSAYHPYPGYRAADGALGEYNGKFMSNQMVLRGGSCVSPRSHLRASYRNFLHPDARWQFSGIRLARDH